MTETDPLPFSHVLRPAALAARKPTRFDIAAAPEACAEIADWAGIEALEALRLQGTLTPLGRSDWRLEAAFTARVVQACVLTLAPVTTDLHETVTRRYLAQMPEPEAEEIEIPGDTDAEPLPDRFDLGALALEVLELALPLYPHAEGATLARTEAVPPGAAPIREDQTRPFANLRSLLGGPGEAPDSGPESGPESGPKGTGGGETGGR
jgi:uncharacterized metal-binding protein YceD (DUF177 family)